MFERTTVEKTSGYVVSFVLSRPRVFFGTPSLRSRVHSSLQGNERPPRRVFFWVLALVAPLICSSKIEELVSARLRRAARWIDAVRAYGSRTRTTQGVSSHNVAGQCEAEPPLIVVCPGAADCSFQRAEGEPASSEARCVGDWGFTPEVATAGVGGRDIQNSPTLSGAFATRRAHAQRREAKRVPRPAPA